MKILAIDTASNLCSVALAVDREIQQRCQLAPKTHGEQVLPMIDELLRGAGIRLQDLDGIAFGRGPGAFTGVRLAIGVAQGLGFGAQVPLVPVSNLAMVAQGAYRKHAVEKIAVAVDARMGEVYWGTFRVVHEIAVLDGDELLCKPEVPTLVGSGWHGCGTGWDAYLELVTRNDSALVTVEGDRLPKAKDAIPLAVAAIGRGDTVPAENAAPTYLRNRVAWR